MIRIAALALLLGGCAKTSLGLPLGESNRALEGLWRDEGGAAYRFDVTGKSLTCTSIVDYDGEIFEVQSSGWDDGVFEWVYRVPSTGYVVSHRVVTVEDDQFNAFWENGESSGRSRFQRQ